MTLSAALTAYANLVSDALVNRCELEHRVVASDGTASWEPIPVPSRILRYHGHGVPDDACDGDGTLSVWFEGPIQVGDSRTPCQGPPSVVLVARWVVCWQLPDADGEGITLFDDQWDADSATLADAAECVARELVRLSCREPFPSADPDDALVDALLAVGRKWRFRGANPVGPGGGVAGVEWRLGVDLYERSPASS